MSLTIKMMQEAMRIVANKDQEKPDAGIRPREIRCITYNIPAGVIYFFPKEADAIKFSKDRITHAKEYGFQNLKNDVEKEFGKTKKCKHDGSGTYGFDPLLQRCRDCGMSAIDIEIERSNDFKRKSEGVTSSMFWKSGVEMAGESEEPLKNYCAPGDVFSQCEAGMNWKDHQKCRFSEKASRAERCMYFRDLNDTEHCDNHLAQKAPYLSTEDS